MVLRGSQTTVTLNFFILALKTRESRTVTVAVSLRCATRKNYPSNMFVFREKLMVSLPSYRTGIEIAWPRTVNKYNYKHVFDR